MNEKVSMLMDGELDEHEFDAALTALVRDDDARRTWRTYHLIRDALRGEYVPGADLMAGVTSRLTREPTVLAPRPGTHRLARRQWMALSAAASLAAVALVGWLAMAPRSASDIGPGMAAVANSSQTGATPVAQVRPRAPVRVPLPSSTDDYLLAHQGYSPRLTLQGVAPYIRTVSDEAVESDSQ